MELRARQACALVATPAQRGAANVDATDKDYTIELTGTGSKLDAFLSAIDRSAILETVRTGASGIGRGDRILRT